MNELISEVLEDYKKDDLIFHPLQKDESISLDRYWFHICIKNLIENALNHGAVPVTVKLRRDGNYLCIDVSDTGKTLYSNLDEMINMKDKKTHSAGLGMGLGIVQRIMKEMKGKLIFNPSPKTFSLYIRSKL